MTHGSLFTGIGGFDLGLEWAGIKTIWQVEIDEYERRRLTELFPDARRYADIRTFPDWDTDGHDADQERKVYQTNPEPSRSCGDGADIRAFAVADSAASESGQQAERQGWQNTCGGSEEIYAPDIISGGFPCQPVSHAGKRQGANDARYLWPEMFRVVQALRPRWVVAENVYGLITHEGGELLDKVYDDLEGEGYETLPPIILPACAFGAPHRRDRVWIVAHTVNRGSQERRPESTESMGRSSVSGKASSDERTATKEPGSFHVANSECKRLEGRQGVGSDQGEELTSAERSGDVCNAAQELLDGRRTARRWRSEPANTDWWATEPAVGRVAHGIPHRVDRLRGLGNAIVPQIAYLIGKVIIELEEKI